MSEDTPHGRSEVNSSPGPTSVGEPGFPQGEYQTQKSNPPSPQTERQEVPVGFGLPFLARVSRGRLNVSEASVPPATSSDISAIGEVFIPAHEHPSEWEGKILQKAQAANKTIADRDSSVPETPQEHSAQQDKPPGDNSDQGLSGNQNVEKSQHGQSYAGQPIPNVFGEVLEPIPTIRIQRPSTATMATSLGTSVMSPAAGATDMVTAPAGLPVDPGSATSSLPVGAVTSALPVPLPVSVPGLSGGREKAKIRRLVGRLRKHIIRKRLLALLLGGELAKIVHPLLSQAGNTAGAVPV